MRQLRSSVKIPKAYEIAKSWPHQAIGHIGEFEVIAELLKRGFDVWRPVWAQHRCDAGISFGSSFLRVQIKSATYDRIKLCFRVPLTHRQARERQAYENGDFDFFLVRCLGADATYVIPATVGIKLGYLNLYPDRERLLRRKEIDLNDYRDKFELLRA
jgi:hypothetical protein